ncbi:hypothetical protein L1887_56336 [Cichorium endivia]|nr:hypothetical protein L1887_56336 [Cichorium endivia]
MAISACSKLSKRRDLESQRLAISGQMKPPKTTGGACKQCRRLRKRCDRRPICAGCSSRGVACEYVVACARPQRPLNVLSRCRKISAQHEGDEIALQLEQLRSQQLQPDTGSSSRSTISPRSILVWPSVANLLEQISGTQAKISSHSQQSLWIYAEPTMSLPGLNSRRESPELTATTINSHFANYVEQIHSIYPFLDIRNVRELLDRYIMSNVARKSAHRSGAHEGPDGHSKRRNALQVFASSQKVDLDDALILLVLALGEVCEHTKSSSCQQNDVRREFGNTCSLPRAKWYTQTMRSLLVASQDRVLMYAQLENEAPPHADYSHKSILRSSPLSYLCRRTEATVHTIFWLVASWRKGTVRLRLRQETLVAASLAIESPGRNNVAAESHQICCCDQRPQHARSHLVNAQLRMDLWVIGMASAEIVLRDERTVEMSLISVDDCGSARMLPDGQVGCIP